MKLNLGDDINKEIKVIIDESIERIEDYAFYDMKIKDVQFNNLNNTQSQLKYIGKYAFAMNKITNLILPWSIKEIDNLAFANNKLTNIQLTDNKIDIKFGDNVFINNNIDPLEQRNYFSILGLVLPSHIFIKSKAIE